MMRNSQRDKPPPLPPAPVSRRSSAYHTQSASASSTSLATSPAPVNALPIPSTPPPSPSPSPSPGYSPSTTGYSLSQSQPVSPPNRPSFTVMNAPKQVEAPKPSAEPAKTGNGVGDSPLNRAASSGVMKVTVSPTSPRGTPSVSSPRGHNSMVYSSNSPSNPYGRQSSSASSTSPRTPPSTSTRPGPSSPTRPGASPSPSLAIPIKSLKLDTTSDPLDGTGSMPILPSRDILSQSGSQTDRSEMHRRTVVTSRTMRPRTNNPSLVPVQESHSSGVLPTLPKTEPTPTKVEASPEGTQQRRFIQRSATEDKFKPKVEDKRDKEYENYIGRARNEDFSDLEKLRMVYHSGHDKLLRPIIVVVASLIPAKTVDLNRLLHFFIKVLDPWVNEHYVLIYVQTNASTENIPKFAWLRKCYSIFSRKYKKNLKQLFIVQPTKLVKGVMNLFKPFISSKFWKKLHYVNEMKELYSFMDPQQIQLSINLLPGEMIASRPEIFGVGLSEVMEHPMNRDSPCPLIVLNCLRYLKKNGTETEGIFRLSGRAQRIEELKQAYNRGEVTDLSNEADVHVIAGLLKSYFRELPDPLCCHHLYPEWIAAYDPNDLENTKRNIAKILKKLPQTNLLTLSLLMGLLAEILVNSAITKMTASNLAICWAPNIIKPLQDSLTSALNDTNYITSIVSLFILHYEEFFPSRGVIEDAVEDTTAPTPAPAPAPLSLTRSDGAV